MILQTTVPGLSHQGRFHSKAIVIDKQGPLSGQLHIICSVGQVHSAR